METINKQSRQLISANDLLLESLNLNAPSCNKCCEACNGCKMKFLKKMAATI